MRNVMYLLEDGTITTTYQHALAMFADEGIRIKKVLYPDVPTPAPKMTEKKRNLRVRAEKPSP